MAKDFDGNTLELGDIVSLNEGTTSGKVIAIDKDFVKVEVNKIQYEKNWKYIFVVPAETTKHKVRPPASDW